MQCKYCTILLYCSLSDCVRRILAETGRMLGIFLLGAATTIVGTVTAMLLVPLHSLGGEGWKVAAALQARHIGGAVNYVAVTEALSISPMSVGEHCNPLLAEDTHLHSNASCIVCIWGSNKPADPPIQTNAICIVRIWGLFD
jgi:uncharacterized membrane protein